MAPPNNLKKEPNPSRLLWLLLVAAGLIVLCSGVIGYMVFRPQKGPELSLPDPSEQTATSATTNILNDQLTTLATLITTEAVKIEEESSTVPTTTSSRNLPTTTVESTTEGSTTASPLVTDTPAEAAADPQQEIVIVEEDFEITPESINAETSESDDVPSASSEEEQDEEEEETVTKPMDTEEIIGKERLNIVNQCFSIPATPIQCSASKDSLVNQPADTFNVIHYKWNVTVHSVQPVQLQASAQIYIQTKEEGKQITLNAGQTLHGLDEIVTIVDCDTGATLCVAKTVVQPTAELITFILSDIVPAGHHLRLHFGKYAVDRPQSVMYSLVPPRYHRTAPSMLGTVVSKSGARKLLPSFDNSIHKAPMDLCVTHSPDSVIRSNSEPSFTTSTLTCFTTTVPLTPQQYAFSVSERAENILTNSTSLDGSYVPSIDIAFSVNKNFKREKHDWIYNEASKVIAVLSNWTQFSYPYSKLSLLSVPIEQPAHSALGIISLQDRLVEYPSYTKAHESLMRAVIGQWLGGIVSTPDDYYCFQDVLTTYLEWKLNEQLQFVNRSRSAEILALRPRDLTHEGQSEERVGRALYKPICPQRFVSVFYTLDETYGQDTVTGMIKEVIKHRAFGTAGMDDWQKAIEFSSGSEDAGKMLIEWFARVNRPIIQAKVTSNHIHIQQLTKQPWTVPVEVVGSSGIQLVTVSNATQQIPFQSHDYVILDPARKSTAFILYDVDTYLRLVRCWEATSCPASRDALKSIFHDFGAALLANHLTAPEKDDVAGWNQVFKFMATHDLADGDVSCCVSYALKDGIKKACTWIIKDTCEKLNLLKALHV